MSSKTYYVTIPSCILSMQMPNAEKLMYGLLNTLSKRDGYCFATNTFIGGELRMSDSAVKNNLHRLHERGMITIVNKQTKTPGNRKIYMQHEEIDDNKNSDNDRVDTNVTKNSEREMDLVFNKFYASYPRKEKKVLALKMFISKKLYSRIDDLMLATKNYASRSSDIDKQFIMLPATFLNNQIWEEYIGDSEEAKRSGSLVAKVSGDPLFDLVKKCINLSSDWFNAAVYEKNVAEMNADDVIKDGANYFSDLEINVLNGVGFRIMLRECTDGDFIISEVKPVWDRLSK